MEKSFKLKIQANNKISGVTHTLKPDGTIHQIEIDFTTSDIWSDLEMWLNNEQDNEFFDYIAFNISKRYKIKTHK